MCFPQKINIVHEFQKTCFRSCLLEIAFRKNNLAYRYSPLFQSLQNALFLVSVALKGTYYENNTFPGIWDVVLGLWCSHTHINLEKSL